MKAVLIKDYSCAPEGHTTEHYKAGRELEGRAAELALADGAAKKASKPKKTPSPKIVKPAAPDNAG